jgi:hypothetical protein
MSVLGSTAAGSPRYRRLAAVRSIAVYQADFANPAAGGHKESFALPSSTESLALIWFFRALALARPISIMTESASASS